MPIACLKISDLALVSALRAEPQLCTEPLAVVQAGHELGGRAHVLGATPAAAGVEPGLTLAEARAVSPGLLVRQASTERERAVAQAACEAALSVSPRIEEAAPGLVYLDAGGLASLFGDDRAVARELVAAAERVGLRAAVGLAASKSVARLAARAAEADLSLHPTRWGVGGGAFHVVAANQQREFLAGVPLWTLDLPEELQQSLRRFGLSTLGEVAQLPPGPLAARLGPEAALLSRLSRGEDAAALAPRERPELFEEGEELEWDASSVEPLLFVWKALLDRLAQLRLSVESRPPPAGVQVVRLSALPTREVLEQMPLFGPRGASATQLAAAVARLAALVGPARVGRPVAKDGWAPYAAGLAKFAPPRFSQAAAPACEPSPAALPKAVSGCAVGLSARALRPPRSAEVRCDEAGAPLLVIGEGALGGRVVASAGPWRTVAEWWTEAPIALDAYDLELAGGLLIRACREMGSNDWWIEAIYD